MNTDTKIILGIVGLTAVIVGFIVINSSTGNRPTDTKVIERGGVATGSSTPKATLVEFSDFQCPACKAVDPLVAQLLAEHAGQMKLIYRHFPLPQHPLAFKAAQASLAAGAQGKFWEYKEKLFAVQETLKESSFEQIAKDLKLNLDQFKKDLAAPETIARVQKDLNDAKSLSLPGTPSFFLEGKSLNLTSFADLTKLVNESLK